MTPPYLPPPQQPEDRWQNVFDEILATLKAHKMSENATYNEIFYSYTPIIDKD